MPRKIEAGALPAIDAATLQGSTLSQVISSAQSGMAPASSVPKIQSGVTGGGGGASSVVSVTFPTAFATTPVVTISMKSINQGGLAAFPMLVSVSTTGFTYEQRTYNGGSDASSFPGHWIAVGT